MTLADSEASQQASRCRQVEALVIQALKQKEAAAANDITSIAPSADAAQEKA